MIKKIWSILTTIIVISVLLIAGLFAVTKFMGGGIYTILSGSMEPTLHVGSVICVKSEDPGDLKEGDIITYAISEDMTATHRIVEIVNKENGLSFVTKGDANETRDANPVDSRNVIGKPFFNIPYLGYVLTYIKRPPWIYFAVVFAVLLLVSGVISKRDGKKRNY